MKIPVDIWALLVYFYIILKIKYWIVYFFKFSAHLKYLKDKIGVEHIGIGGGYDVGETYVLTYFGSIW